MRGRLFNLNAYSTYSRYNSGKLNSRRSLAALFFLFCLNASALAQTYPNTTGDIDSSVAPVQAGGAGGYSESSIEHLNLYNGHLNVTVAAARLALVLPRLEPTLADNTVTPLRATHFETVAQSSWPWTART